MLASVVHSVILYAAPVWHEAMNVDSYRSKFERVQRTVALRVCSAYRIVSKEALQVLSGLPPIKLLAEERNGNHLSEKTEEEKRLNRTILLDKWQEMWTSSTNGTWTRKLIPAIKPSVERASGELNYRLNRTRMFQSILEED